MTKMFELPLGPYVIPVYYVNSEKMQQLAQEDGDDDEEETLYSGLFDYDNKVIYILETCTPDEATDTLIHECVHAITRIFGLDVKYFPTEGDRELVAGIIGAGLAQMLKGLIKTNE